ncbi:MAG: hypothetical protein KME30_09195 [Iphinoe sp. HA4291-MV1]|jgi:hypothetical protein|nr:hypothetical protein [Iphinoe sp. HA4291-MV1]
MIYSSLCVAPGATTGEPSAVATTGRQGRTRSVSATEKGRRNHANKRGTPKLPQRGEPAHLPRGDAKGERVAFPLGKGAALRLVRLKNRYSSGGSGVVHDYF